MAIRIRVYPQEGSIGLRRRRAVRVQQQQIQRQQLQLIHQQQLLRQQQVQVAQGYGGMGGFGGMSGGYGGMSSGYGGIASSSGQLGSLGLGTYGEHGAWGPAYSSSYPGSYGFGPGMAAAPLNGGFMPASSYSSWAGSAWQPTHFGASPFHGASLLSRSAPYC